MPHASLESAGLSAITGETDSSNSVADSITTTNGQALSASEAATSEALAAMAASMAQGSQSSLWNTQNLADRYCPRPLCSIMGRIMSPGSSREGSMVFLSPAHHAHCMAFACHRALAASD